VGEGGEAGVAVAPAVLPGERVCLVLVELVGVVEVLLGLCGAFQVEGEFVLGHGLVELAQLVEGGSLSQARVDVFVVELQHLFEAVQTEFQPVEGVLAEPHELVGVHELVVDLQNVF